MAVKATMTQMGFRPRVRDRKGTRETMMHRRQQRRHDGVGHHPLGVEQGHNVQDHRQELGAGVQPVDEGIAREKLAQGDILSAYARLPS